MSDWQWIKGATAPVTLNPGPGPYIDRVRIGRVTFSGPTFGVPGYDGLAPSYYASQDGFPSARPNSFLEDFVPTTDRFGTVDFAASSVDVFSPYPPGSPYTYNSRDSIVVRVEDPRGAGVTSVGVHAAIVAGPHAGKAPPPWNVGANGFFYVPADSARSSSGAVQPDRCPPRWPGTRG